MVKGRPHKVAFNLLSSLVYFFLFSIQLSGRFYTVANYCVYRSSPTMHAAGLLCSDADGKHKAANAQLPLYETPSSSSRQHLSVDKRYQMPDFLAVAVHSCAAPVPPYTFMRRKTRVSPGFWIPPFTIVNLLRGPPAAGRVCAFNS
ncbi:MAG: hypothetical protein P4L51_00425 [Puia sp.]|nr:hypothetical protein [Puia sp.]